MRLFIIFNIERIIISLRSPILLCRTLLYPLRLQINRFSLIFQLCYRPHSKIKSRGIKCHRSCCVAIIMSITIVMMMSINSIPLLEFPHWGIILFCSLGSWHGDLSCFFRDRNVIIIYEFLSFDGFRI